MPRVNLLPIKQARKRDTAKHELFLVIGGVFAALIGLYLWYTGVESDIATLAERVRRLDSDIEALKLDVAKVEDFKGKQKTIEKKLEAIDKLAAQKVGPAMMLDELAGILTDKVQKVWLTSFQESDGKLKLAGGAMSPEKVSELQTALELGKFFANVKLLSIKSKRADGDLTFVEWELTCITTYRSS